MEFIAAAIVMLAIFVPVFLALEVATPHAEPNRLPILASAETAAERYLAAHPLKPVAAREAAPEAVAEQACEPANEALERLAA